MCFCGLLTLVPNRLPFHRKAFLQHIHFYFKAQSSEAFESLVLSDRYVNQNLEETDYVVCYVYR